MTQAQKEKVCVIGIWHLGLVTAICMADLGFNVVGVDPDPERVKALNRGHAPIFEPGAHELLLKHIADGSLRFTTELSEGAGDSTHVLVTYDTPVNEEDDVDLSGIYHTFEGLASCLAQDAVIIVSAQVPVGTCESLAALIRNRSPNLRFGIGCMPENLRLGQAIERFLHPDMLVIGAEDEATLTRIEHVFSKIESPRVVVDLRTAEMTKHAMNAYLATAITFGNEIANICDLVGADATRVVEALRLERRVSPLAPLFPGLGFSGGTLARDMKVLQRLSKEYNYEAPLINGVLQLNSLQNQVVIRSIQRQYGHWQGLKIGVLGLTYKPGTSTVRRSAAIEMITVMASAGAQVKAYDPQADPDEVTPHLRYFERVGSPYEAAEGADALVLATTWPEFNDLDFPRLRGLMARPLLLDPNNALKPDELTRVGFTYRGVGRGQNSARQDTKS